MARETKAARTFDADEEREWEKFKKSVEAATSYIDALLVVKSAVRPDAPGRKFYSNLGFFLANFSCPAEATNREVTLYGKLVQDINDFPNGKREIAAESLSV